MRTIVVANFKGGVGKTTTAVNLAHAIARRGQRVLLVDADTQGNASKSLGVEGAVTLYELVVDGKAASEGIYAAREGLDVIPGNRNLTVAEEWMTTRPRREDILKRKLREVDGYDFVVVDTAPAGGLLNINAMNYAEELLIPVAMEYLALVGVKDIIDAVEIVNEELEHALRLRYVVPTFYDVRNARTSSIVEAMRESFAELVTDPIRINTKLSEAPSYKKTIFEYAPSSAGAVDYEFLAERVLNDGRPQEAPGG
jgi:chromosome partitioning protein